MIMKTISKAILLSQCLLGTESSNSIVSGFVPGTMILTNISKSINRNSIHSPPSKTAVHKKRNSFRLHSSSSSEHPNTVSSPNQIQGPCLPPIDGSSKRLFLVRHGEVINPGGDRPVYYGALDVPLSPLGEAEARAAALYLQQFDLSLVVSSPLSRAIYGAEQVLSLQSKTAAPVIVMNGFKELDRGSWCGKTKGEIGAETMARFDACDPDVTPDGGESYPELKNRVLLDKNEVLGRLPQGQAAVIVSHLQVTRSMLSEALGIPTAEMATLSIATASVTCIDYNVDGTQIVHFQSFKPDVGLEESTDGAN